MAYAKVTYTGNGATTNYTVTFPYLDEDHVKVYVEGTLKTVTTHYTWLNSTTIQFVTAPTNGDTIVILRNSSQTTRLTDYQDSSTLTATLLDADANQMFYMAQEALDYTGSTMSLSATTDQWDALSKRITNVADPTSAQDAATKAYVDAAPASATAAAASAAAALVSETNAETAETNAETAEANAEAAQALAEAAAVAAAASAAAALTSENNAETAEVNAETAETNAEAAQAAAEAAQALAEAAQIAAEAAALAAAGFTNGDYGLITDAVGTTSDYGTVP